MLLTGVYVCFCSTLPRQRSLAWEGARRAWVHNSELGYPDTFNLSLKVMPCAQHVKASSTLRTDADEVDREPDDGLVVSPVNLAPKSAVNTTLTMLLVQRGHYKGVSANCGALARGLHK